MQADKIIIVVIWLQQPQANLHTTVIIVHHIWYLKDHYYKNINKPLLLIDSASQFVREATNMHFLLPFHRNDHYNHSNYKTI